MISLRIKKLARKKNRKSSWPHHWVQCFLLRGNRVLRYSENKDSKHAEERLLEKPISKPHLCTVVVVRIRKDGSLGASKPCHKCMRLLKEANIGKITYA